MEERPIKALKAALTNQNQKKTREFAQKAKGCLKGKKVARNTRSYQKVADQLVESPMRITLIRSVNQGQLDDANYFQSTVLFGVRRGNKLRSSKRVLSRSWRFNSFSMVRHFKAKRFYTGLNERKFSQRDTNKHKVTFGVRAFESIYLFTILSIKYLRV